jgi:hypothetical protein
MPSNLTIFSLPFCPILTPAYPVFNDSKLKIPLGGTAAIEALTASISGFSALL